MRWHSVVLPALIFLTTGCLSGRPRQVYALSDAVDNAMELTARGTAPELQLRRILVPDYLDTTNIVMRFGAHQLRESPSGHWSERLSLEVTRAVWADLGARLPPGTITLDQWPRTPMREILIGLDAFDVWPDGRCLLVANWSILDADHKAVLAAGHGTFGTPGARKGPGDRAVVAGMANTLQQLADAVAAALPAAAHATTAGNEYGQ